MKRGLTKIITFDDLHQIILPYESKMTIWKVGLRYGSTLYFEMGEKYFNPQKRWEYGEFCLELLVDDWALYKGNHLLYNSSTITSHAADTELNESLQKVELVEFIKKRLDDSILIKFTENYHVLLSYKNNPIDSIFALSLPGGRTVELKQDSDPVLELFTLTGPNPTIEPPRAK